MARMPITDVVTIYKMVRDGDIESYETSPTYTLKNACISPTGQDVQTGEGGVYSYQLFEIFIWDVTVDLRNGDKIVSGNTEYLVTGTPNTHNTRYMQGIRTLAKVIV